jgi:hypothetical protein
MVSARISCFPFLISPFSIMANPVEIADRFRGSETVADGDIDILSQGVEEKLQELEARKNDLLGAASRRIRALEQEAQQQSADQQQATLATIEKLHAFKRSLLQRGAQMPSADREFTARDGGTAAAVVGRQAGEFAGNRFEMSTGNLALLVEKHPVLSTVTGIGLISAMAKWLNTKEGEKEPSLWRKAGRLAVGGLATLLGVNVLAYMLHPDKAARLETQKQPTT